MLSECVVRCQFVPLHAKVGAYFSELFRYDVMASVACIAHNIYVIVGLYVHMGRIANPRSIGKLPSAR